LPAAGAAASIPAMDRRPANPPPLPLNQRLQTQLEAWTRLRDQLVELNAQLETLRLMARLQQRR
jgi:hypothetical protein